jgi:hypothetical protein
MSTDFGLQGVGARCRNEADGLTPAIRTAIAPRPDSVDRLSASLVERLAVRPRGAA